MQPGLDGTCGGRLPAALAARATRGFSLVGRNAEETRSDAGREDEVGSREEAGGTFFAMLTGDGRAGVTTPSAACKAGEKGEGKVTPAVTPMTAN